MQFEEYPRIIFGLRGGGLRGEFFVHSVRESMVFGKIVTREYTIIAIIVRVGNEQISFVKIAREGLDEKSFSCLVVEITEPSRNRNFGHQFWKWTSYGKVYLWSLIFCDEYCRVGSGWKKKQFGWRIGVQRRKKTSNWKLSNEFNNRWSFGRSSTLTVFFSLADIDI